MENSQIEERNNNKKKNLDTKDKIKKLNIED